MIYLNRPAVAMVRIILSPTVLMNLERPNDRNQSLSVARIQIIHDIKTKNRRQDRLIFQEGIPYQEKSRISIQNNTDLSINRIASEYKKIQSMIKEIIAIMQQMM